MRSALAIAFLIICATAVSMASGGEYLQVDEVTMSVNGNATVFQVNYTLDNFARLYVLALGCRHLEPDLDRLFTGYPETRITRADPYRAVIEIDGTAKYSSGYYLFDSRPLGTRVETFRVIYPRGMVRTFNNVTSTPNIFIEANASTMEKSPGKLDTVKKKLRKS
ncbi:MAG: hypothetical protein GKC10_07775 [Methanosarcinales archaeon]|nr:hypothetical protein [Methanosarcinales archaeon]